MSRLKYIRDIIIKTESYGQSREDQLIKFAHLQGVASIGQVLAIKRGLNPEIAAVAGLLHDIYTYRTGLTELHAHNGEEEARVILRDSGVFTEEEQSITRSAIRKHSDKSLVDGPYDELLKDADVLEYYLAHPHELSPPVRCSRLAVVFKELGLNVAMPPEEPHSCISPQTATNRRELLATIAEELAAKPLIANKAQSGADVFPLIRYFPGTSQTSGFDWCAAFVFHCCQKAGIILPIKYPDPVPCRFAGVRAWVVWAQLFETGFWHNSQGFIPERGDIVVFDQLVSTSPHDHMGIVTGYREGIMMTAEGNVNNQSGLFERALEDKVRGFIRIPDSYSYNLR